MQKYRILLIAALALILASLCATAWSQGLPFTNRELDKLMGPIALYPDPLIAQILPASTYPDELSEADDLVRQGVSSRELDRRDWDLSVRAVAHYPNVLGMMVDNPDWTTSVGQAYVEEPDHVMDSIQRLRAKARHYGHLSSNSRQRVYLDQGYIRIVPVSARYIYVPSYNPEVVYVQRRSSINENLISFGLGLLIGAWLNRDTDYHRHRVYYHGWSDGGWVHNSRSYVDLHNNYYVNNVYRSRPVEVNRNIRARDIGSFRTQIRSNTNTYAVPNFRRPTRNATIRNMPNIIPNTGRRGTNNILVPRSTTPRTTMPSVRTAPRTRMPSVPSGGNPTPRGINRRSSTPGAAVPSLGTPSKTYRQNNRTNTKPNPGTNRRSYTPRTSTPSVESTHRATRQDYRGNSNPNEGVNRRSSTPRTSSPSTVTTPRSGRQGDHENVGRGNGPGRSGPSGRSQRGSRSKSKSNDQSQGNPGNDNRNSRGH